MKRADPGQPQVAQGATAAESDRESRLETSGKATTDALWEKRARLLNLLDQLDIASPFESGSIARQVQRVVHSMKSVD